MKKNVWLLVLAATWILVQTNCHREEPAGENTAETEARAIADSLRDADKLRGWIQHFEARKEQKAALLIRQRYGQVLRDKSDFEAAIKQHDTCIALAKNLKDTMQMIIAYNNQGTNFRRLGDLHGASNNHYAALELCDHSMSDTSYTARKNRVRTYNGLGNVLLSLHNDSVAETLFHRALAGETELGSATGQAINYANIGAIKEGRGELDSALIYYNMSMQKNRETSNPIGICLCYQNLGRLHHISGETDKALDNYRKAYEIGRQTSDVWHWLKPCEAIAEIFLDENKKDSAQEYLNTALTAAEKIKSRSHLARVYSLYARLQEQSGKHEQAIRSVRLAQAYKDSIAVEQNRTHIQNLRVNYEVKKRVEDVERAQTEAGYQKKLRWIATWACIVIVILIILVMLSQVRIHKERQKTLKAMKRADKDRQEFYRGITHQLRTPLTVINGMIEQLSRFLPTDNDVAQKELNAMERKSEELLTLVREMIEFNKGTRKEVKVTELALPSNRTPSTEVPETRQEHPTEPYILVAEDDSDVALLITEMLKEEEYPYYWAKDGQEAYDTIIAPPPPLLIITDVMMPNMDGLELIKRIRKEQDTRHLPVIVVSARVEDGDKLAGLEAGAEVYLGKPFVPAELMLRIRKLLEQREVLKQKYSKVIEEADKTANEQLELDMSETEQEYMNKVDMYIRENIMDSKLDAAVLADHMNTSLTTLNRKVKSITGTNTTNYIRLSKLGRASQLLMNTDMYMGEIQAVCGFESPSYFSRSFKAEFGMTPSEYRKKMRK